MITLSDPGMFDPLRDGPFIHPRAIVEGTKIGLGTRIWAFAHVLTGAQIGRDCNLCDHTFVEGDVIVGDRVTIKSGVYLWDGTRIDDDVFVGPNVTFTNDRTPRSRQYPDQFEGVTLRKGCSIGAGAVLLPGVEIGEYAMIGAGAVVTKSVPAHALMVGNPARQVGQVCACGKRAEANIESPKIECSSCQTRERSIAAEKSASASKAA